MFGMNSLLFILCMVYFAYGMSTPFPQHAIVVKDNNGNILTSYSTLRSTSSLLYCSVIDNAETSWSIQPIVKGITIESNGWLRINVPFDLPKTNFIITASLENENVTLPFDIEILGCEYGDFLKIETTGSVDLLLYRESELVYNGTKRFQTLCVPVSTYRVVARGKDAFNWISIYSESNVHFYTARIITPTLEGTFSNDLTMKPSISFPSVVSLSPSSEKDLLLSSQGPIDKVVIEPHLDFSFTTFIVTISKCRQDMNYTITAFHGNETAQTSFTVYCGSCPDGYSFITTVFDGNNAYYTLPDIETTATYRRDQSFCIAVDSFHVAITGSYVKSLAFYYDNHFIYDTGVVDFRSYSDIVVRWKKSITFSSPLSYVVGVPTAHWAEWKFAEDGWSKSKEGSWGSYGSSSTAAFRAPFHVQNREDYSQALLLLRGEGDAVVFVNGNEFGKVSLVQNSTSVAIPFSLLLDGNNLIGVHLTKGASSTVLFGLAVEFINSLRVPTMSGEISAIEASPDPKHPPSMAFFEGSEYTTYWNVSSSPSELIFTFNNNTYQIVNELRINKATTTNPYAFQIVGVTGDERVPLATFNRDSTSYGGDSKVHLRFQNTRAFPSYHVVFTASNITDTIKIFNMFFYSRRDYYCAKKYGIKNAVDGSTFFKRCPLFTTGRKRVTCTREESNVFWAQNTNQCYTTNPSSAVEFLDWTFTVRGMGEDEWEKKASKMTEMIADETYLRGRDIAYMHADFVVDGEVTVMTCYSRCTVESGMGRALKRNLLKLAPRFGELVAKWMEKNCTASIDSATLYYHVNWMLVIITSLVIIAILTLLALYLVSRVKQGNVKRLIKKNTRNEQEITLLCCFCYSTRIYSRW